MYSIIIINGYIVEARNDNVGEPIPEKTYTEIVAKFKEKPKAEAGFDYLLRASDLEWELVELPPEPEPEPTVEDKAEAYDILTGVSE